MATLNVMTTSDLTALIPEKWDRKVRDDRIQREFWSRFEGKEGTMSAVISKNDFKKEAGDKIWMETLSELYAAPTTGESTLQGGEEKYGINQFYVTIELYRHAVAVTQKLQQQEIISSINRAAPKLGRYFAKLYDEFAFAELLSPSNATAATMGTAQASLSNTDRLTPDVLDAIKLGLIRRGALPIEAKINEYGEYLEVYGVVIDEVSAFHLQTNSTFRQTIRDALPRNTKNPMFTGALGMWNNLVLYQYRGIHQGCHQGTPQRPENAVASAVTASDTTITVGTVADRDYTKHFASAGDLTIYADGTNATEDIHYTGKTIATFTGVTQTVGGGGGSGTANDHLVGTRIVQYNHLSTLIGFGAESLARAWGPKDLPIAQVDDFTFERGVGLLSVTGVAAIEDSAGNVPNYILHTVYADLPDLKSTTL